VVRETVLLHFDFKAQQYRLKLHPWRDGYQGKCRVHGVGVG
jgi:hypothetical protein